MESSSATSVHFSRIGTWAIAFNRATNWLHDFRSDFTLLLVVLIVSLVSMPLAKAIVATKLMVLPFTYTSRAVILRDCAAHYYDEDPNSMDAEEWALHASRLFERAKKWSVLSALLVPAIIYFPVPA